MKDEYGDVRRSAAYALGKLGDKRAIEPLTEALKDEYYTVRWMAARALKRIKKIKE